MNLFADFVAEVLKTAAQPHQRRYLLIDSSATCGVDVTRETGLGGLCIDLLTHELCAWKSSASPVLMPLPETPLTAFRAEQLARWLIKWQYANCVLLIETPLALADMLTELKARTEAVLPDNMSVVLRYFDARVLPVLLKVLSASDRASFLGCATRWAWPDRRGALMMAETAEAPQPSPFQAPLQLDEQQQAELIDAGEADAVIDVLLNEGDATLMAMLPPDQHDAISNALTQARTLRITQWGSQLSFCSLSLALGAAFYQAEPWASLMPKVTSGARQFGGVVAELSQAGKS